MSHTLRMIPDAGCIEPFHIQRKQKPEGRILFTSGIKSHNCTLRLSEKLNSTCKSKFHTED